MPPGPMTDIPLEEEIMSAYCHVRKILANLSEKGLARFITFCAAICVCAASCKHHDVDFKNVADTRSRLAAIIEAVRDQVYFEQRPLPDLSSMGELRSWLLEGEHVIPFSSKDSFGREFIVQDRKSVV